MLPNSAAHHGSTANIYMRAAFDNQTNFKLPAVDYSLMTSVISKDLSTQHHKIAMAQEKK